MSLILVRYAEIGLKSRPVRRRFESILRENITKMLIRDGIESLISSDEGRLYLECDDVEKATVSLRRVFGVASISVTEVFEGGLSEICSSAAEYSKGRLQQGQSFAVRPRREGVHEYTSVDLGREVGSAIFLANEFLDVRVNLRDPDVEFFVEVRQKKAYLFTDYLSGPGGLPMGSQGKVVAVVDNNNDALAAWLMMRRGCEALILGQGPLELLQRYDTDLRFYKGRFEDIYKDHDILGVVYGYTIDEMQNIEQAHNPELTSFHPLVGMSKEEIGKMFVDMV